LNELETALTTDRCAGAHCGVFRFGLLIFISILTAPAATSQTSPEIPYYGRTNSFGVLVAYSGDSSHILLGEAEQRKLLEIGVSYSRKLIQSRVVNWQYSGELLPVVLEGDPLTSFVNVQTSPTMVTSSGNLPYPIVTCTLVTDYSYTFNGITYSGTQTDFCHGRRWTMGEGMSPVGMQWNFLPHRTVQPLFIGHGGYMYSTEAIPIETSGSFNFTFDVGVGLEWYRSPSRSIRAEYRYHHISNHNTAYQNPGIDSGLFQVSYVFGH
jgi:opacity protein-like surface antigen